MKVYILVDAEGISGVVNHTLQVKPDSPGYGEMRTLLMSDLNAAVEGAVGSGAQDILVYDMHYYGLNVVLEKLHTKARVIMGKPPKVVPPSGIDESYAALIMIGYHAMAETEDGLLSHTYTLDMKALRLNGVLIGEIGMEAAIAGSRDVPLVMISGDDAVMREARTLIGDFEEACVKNSTGRESALCLPISQASELITRKVRAALRRLDSFQPYKAMPPYTVGIEFYEESSARRASAITGVRQKSAKVVEITGDDLACLWESFLHSYAS
jgi:D-amino peptidase